MSKNKIFIFFVIGFLIGIFLGNIFSFKIVLILFCLILMFFGILLLVIKKHHFFVLILNFGLFLGLMYSQVNNYYIGQNISKINNYFDKEVIIEAELSDLYKKQNDNNIYIFKIISFNNYSNFDFNFLLYTSSNIALSKGQIIKFQSKINKIENFTGNFNYIKFMQSKNVYFSVYKPKIEFLPYNNIGDFDKYIINFRQKFINIIYNIYPKNEAIFLSGLLIGDSDNLDENILKNFNNSGLTHIISVSGFNITIIIIFLGLLLKYFPLFLRVIIISLLIIFFVLIVGNGVAVIRASIMGLVGYYILILGRKADSLSLLLFTAFLMILYNPLYLNFDLSFHLSFLAVLGLLYFQDFWNKIFKFIPNFFAIREAFVLTMSAMTTTIPIMIFSFGKVSILAPISNMLVGGIIPFTMLFGFLSILGQIISDKLGFLIGFINYYLLNFIIRVADFIGNLSYAVLEIDFSIYAIYFEIIYFILLIFCILYIKKETTKLR